MVTPNENSAASGKEKCCMVCEFLFAAMMDELATDGWTDDDNMKDATKGVSLSSAVSYTKNNRSSAYITIFGCSNERV